MGSRLTITGADWLLPAVLSTTAGAVDVAIRVPCSRWTVHWRHITGNLVILAAHYVTGGFSEVLGPLLSVPVFVATLGVVTLVSVSAKKAGQRVRFWLLVLHAVRLTGCMCLAIACGPFDHPDRPLSVLVGMLAVAAMATQNGLVRLDLPVGSCPPR